MQVVYERCCGLDVHKRTVVACVLLSQADGTVEREVRTFRTMTADLLALADWLSALEVGQVAMESTGVYWRPVYTLLEEGRSIVLVNPQHLKRVPGHKTDVKDAEWLADLLCHGLLQASFIPPQPVRAVRALTRYRKTLVQERAQAVLRVQKVLESANVKLASVATDVLGKSGRAMLPALVGGEQDPEALAALAALARGGLRAKLPDLRLALEGRVRPVHLVQLRLLLEHSTFLESALAELQQEIERLLVPFADAVALAQTIPGVAQTAAIAPRGQESAQGTNRAGASASAGISRRGTAGCAPSWARSPGRSPLPRTTISRLSFTASPVDEASRKRSWRWRTVC